MIRKLIGIALIVYVIPVCPSPYGSRSRTRSSSPTYDQKQTGDYNIQLHLKDFQVVALLSEGALSDLGDYDYSYDYSELTVKPSGPTTQKPSTTPKEKPIITQTTTTTTQAPTTTTQRPTTIAKVISTTTAAPTTSTTVYVTPTKVNLTTPTTTTSFTTTSAPTTTAQPTAKITQKPEKLTEVKTTARPITTTTEKKIHVEVIQAIKDTKLDDPIIKDENKIDKIPADISTLAVKPNEVGLVNNKEELNQTDLLTPTNYRKCANGYQRDKQGRCRRVRRPVAQFPFGISRLATLASKLRQATGDGQTPNLE